MNCFSLRLSILRSVALCGATLIIALSALSWPDAFASTFEMRPEGVEATVPAQEDVPDDPEGNLPYLFAVFIVTWGAFFGYLIYISRRQSDMAREIDALQAAFDQETAEPDETRVRGAR